MPKEIPDLTAAIVATIAATENVYLRRFLQLNALTLNTAGELYLKAQFLETKRNEELMKEFSKVIGDLLKLFPQYLGKLPSIPFQDLGEFVKETPPPVHHSTVKIYEDFIHKFICELRAVELIKR